LRGEQFVIFTATTAVGRGANMFHIETYLLRQLEIEIELSNPQGWGTTGDTPSISGGLYYGVTRERGDTIKPLLFLR
jgi:hypothetical protein